MKAIIKGKRYDTAKAELIAEHAVGQLRDFNGYTEDLYRTLAGAWFLAGEGGALTKYAKHNGDEKTGGQGIRVLTEEQAQSWLEARGELEALERFFNVEDA